MDADSILAELLLCFVVEVVDVERVLAQANCDGIKSMIFTSDGSINTIDVKMRDQDNNLCNLTPVPVIAVASPSLLYMKEISIEVKGDSTLRDSGERLRSFPTKELNLEGQRLRKALADNNLNSETNLLNDSINNNTYPNIYYIIPDSYPGNESLKEYINFDNIDFLNYLKENKFNVFDKSLSNYWFTHFSVPSTLNMDYLYNCCNISEDGFIKLTPDVKKVFENNKIFNYLKNKGYKIISIISEWENNQELIRTNSEQLYFGNNTNYSFLVTLFDNSLLSYLFKILKYKNRIEEINNIVKFFQSKKTNKQPEFIFVHMLMPHPPFIINKNLKLDYKKTILSQNFQESFKSLLKKEKPEDIINQIKYTNKILESIIESILEKDKDSIIVIQSDHGNHMSEFFGKKDNFEYEYDITFFNILKSIYYKGEKVEFHSLTSVNTFRNIFNLCFNDNFEILEDKLQINDPSSCTDTRVGIGMNMKFNEIDVKDANFFN